MPTRGIKSVKTCFKILSLFNIDTPKLTALEISNSIDLPKSSVYRYLNSLSQESILEYDPIFQNYTLGLKVFQMAASIYHQQELRRTAAPFIEELANKTKETVHLAVLCDSMVMCIDRIESAFPVRLSLYPGKLFPIHAGATGKALLAYLPGDERDRIIRKGLKKFTQNTIVDPVKLKKELEAISRNGFAYSDQELDLGARAIAVPIFDFLGKVIASLSIAGPVHRFTEKTIAEHKDLIVDYSKRISSKLGYHAENIRRKAQSQVSFL